MESNNEQSNKSITDQNEKKEDLNSNISKEDKKTENESKSKENKKSKKSITESSEKDSNKNKNTKKSNSKAKTLYKYTYESSKTFNSFVNNPRYMGFYQYNSSTTLRNSSYIFSFPKNKRFITENLSKMGHSDKMYNLPMLKSTRATGFGFGNKLSLQSSYGIGTPSPDRYHLLTYVDLNRRHNKGPKFLEKLPSTSDNNKAPGPGSYNINKNTLKIDLPVTIKSRKCMFYDDDLKKKIHCVSMQKYHPNTILQQNTRYTTISFGIGERGKVLNAMRNNPGPGTYNVRGCFEKGLKKKLALN